MKQNNSDAELLKDAIIKLAQELLVLSTNVRHWEEIMAKLDSDRPIDFDKIYWPEGTPGKPTATWVAPLTAELTRWQNTETTEMLTRLARKLLVVASNVEHVVGAFLLSGDTFDQLHWPIGTPDKLTAGYIEPPNKVLERWEAKQAPVKGAKSVKSKKQK